MHLEYFCEICKYYVGNDTKHCLTCNKYCFIFIDV